MLTLLAMASDLILAMVGDEWISAAPALRTLCLLGMLVALSRLRGPLLMAVGKPMWLGALSWSQTAVLALSLLIAGQFVNGLTPGETATVVACCRVAVFLVVIVPTSVLVARVSVRIRLSELAAEAAPALAAAAAGAIMYVLLSWIQMEMDRPESWRLQLIRVGFSALPMIAVLLLMDPRLRSQQFDMLKRTYRYILPSRFSLVKESAVEVNEYRTKNVES